MRFKNWSKTIFLSVVLFVVTIASLSFIYVCLAQGQVARLRMRLGEERTLEDGLKIGLSKGEGDVIIVTVSRPTVETSKAPPSDLGVWDFRLNFNRIVGKDGFIKKQAGVYDMVVRLRQRGNLLSGELLGSVYNNNMTWCDDGTITGTIQGNRVSLILQFGDKINCCPGEQWKFTGTLNSNATLIEGSEEPVDLPTSTTCISLYSDFAARRR